MHIYPDINEAFRESLVDLDQIGKKLIIRGSEVIEATDYSFIISNPTRRFLTCPYRYNNIAATVFETLWVMSGRNDLELLKFFLPNCVDYSDNGGKTWGAGYGNRLRYYHPNYNRYSLFAPGKGIFEDGKYISEDVYGIPFYDQIDNVIKTLQQDPFSRQAIIVIPQPNIDYDINIKTKDRSCTIFVQFLIRDDQLNCYVRSRSNDILWGVFNVNVFEFTFLQEIIAGILDTHVGEYHHNAVSFHYYMDKSNRIKNIINSKRYNVYKYENCENIKPIKYSSLADFYGDNEVVLKIIEELIKDIFEEYNLFLKTNLTDYLRIIISFIGLKNNTLTESYNLIDNINRIDMKVAALEYFIRFVKKQCPSCAIEFINKIEKENSFSQPTIDFITGNWS